MSAKQKRGAAALIREECANCFQCVCIPLDTPCPQMHSDSLLCRWFQNAVLPLEKSLYDEIMRSDNLKTCSVCGRLFRAMSNRAKYCAECKSKARRRMDAKRKREAYYRE